MKNILYIGPYKENNGMGRSARRIINALSSSIDINLAVRPIYLTQNTVFDNLEKDLIDFTEFEENTFSSYDSVIQHGYPDMFQYDSRFGKNIGITEIETYPLNHSGWIEKINLLDEVVVPSFFSAKSLADSGVTVKIKTIPEPYNTNFYDQPCDNFFVNFEHNNKPFIFYSIGQYSDRKNFKAMIVAFLLEFDKTENVKFFIKTGDYYQENNILEQLISYDIKQLQKCIRKNPLQIPDIDILCGILKDDDIKRLHRSADCYVNAVKCDSFGPCAIEALLCDKIVINSNNIGSSSYINSTNAIVIDSVPASVFTSDFYSKNTFTMYENWCEPSINMLRKAMRQAFNMSKTDINEKLENFDKRLFTKEYFLEQFI